MDTTRRRVIAATALFGLAGCLDRQSAGSPSSPSDSPTPSTELPMDLQLADGVPTIALSAITDGEFSVGDGLLVKYTAPIETTFDAAAVHEGHEIAVEPTSDELRVDLAIPAGLPPTVSIVPIYHQGEGFEYRIYANKAFRELHDWQVAAGTGSVFDGDGIGSRAVAFEGHYAHVHRDVVTADLVPDANPSDPLSVGVFQYDHEQLRSERPDDITGVMLFGRRGPRRTPSQAPAVQFTIDDDPSAETVTITHDGGDHVNADNLLVRVDDTPTAAQWDDEYETVTAGTDLTVDVSKAPSGATLRVIWESDDGSSAATLARHTVS